MLERNRLIQHVGNAECLSPEPLQNSNKKDLSKSLSGSNLQNISESVNHECIDNQTTINGKTKSTKYTENEQQSTSSASGVSSPDNNSRDEDSKQVYFCVGYCTTYLCVNFDES